MTPEAKKRMTWTIAFLVVFFLVVGIAAAPAWRAIKQYQARQQSIQASELLAEEVYEEALEKARAAYVNDPENPDVVRVVAEVYDEVDPKQAPAFWEQAFGLSDENSDLNNWVAAAIKVGDTETAKAQLEKMKDRGQVGSTYHYYRGQVLVSERDLAGALAEAREAIAAENPDERAHFFYVQVSQFFDDPAILNEGIRYLWQLARQRDELGMRALRNLAKYQGNTDEDRLEIIRLVEGHPFAERDDQLIALKLEYQMPDANPQANLASAKRYFNTESLPELAKFGRWLNGQQRYAQTVQVIPMEKALKREEVFLVLLDAMAQLGRWDEIGRALQSPLLPLKKDFLRQLFLSRVQYETGKLAEAQITWDRAVLSAANDAESLWFLVKYARMLDLNDEAIRALWRLTELPIEQRKAFNELLLMYQTQRDTKGLQETLQRMSEAYPDDLDVLNDWAYVNLLLKRQVPLSVETARNIILRNPPYLANRITLALGLFRMGELNEALQVLEPLNVDWSQTPSKWRVIYASILHANGKRAEAARLLQGVKASDLLPEERDLIRGLTSGV